MTIWWDSTEDDQQRLKFGILSPKGLKGGRGIKPGEFSLVQSLSRVLVFATPWTAACQASLSMTNSRSLRRLMSNRSVMPSNHLILHCPLFLLLSIFPSCHQSFPGSGSFPVRHFFSSRREWQITSLFLPWEPHEQYEKGKKLGEEERKLKLFSYIGSDDL